MEVSITGSGAHDQDRVLSATGTNSDATYTGETVRVGADGKAIFTLTVSGVDQDDNLTIKWANPS